MATEISNKRPRDTEEAVPASKVQKTENDRYSILAVEDNEMNQKLIKRIATQGEEFLKLIIANDGNEGVARAKEEKFDIIFMDYRMPNKEGNIATKEIRTLDDSKNKLTPIIIQSSDTDANVAFKDTGYTDVLGGKLIKLSQVTDTIKKLVSTEVIKRKDCLDKIK